MKRIETNVSAKHTNKNMISIRRTKCPVLAAHTKPSRIEAVAAVVYYICIANINKL